MYLSRSKRAPAWFHKETDALLLPPIVSIKHLSKITKLPLNALVKGFCHKNGKIYWYRHNRMHYEFNQKSQIIFPYKYASKKLEEYIDKEIKIWDIEPQPIDLDQYSSTHQYDERSNKKQCVISIMGHVDHGKTTLLDTIRNTNVAEYESGAITQCVSCYHYNLSPINPITFIDTPGHEVFFKMRSNSVIVADAVILVIDIMEGVQKQTFEVIKKAKQLSIPLLLALNKIDKVLDNTEISGNLDEILSSTTKTGKKLSDIINNINLQLDDVIKINDEESLAFDIVPISAKYNVNIDQMLFSLDILSNAIQIMSPRDIEPQAIVLEASSDNNGSYLMLIIHAGILKTDMIIVGGYIAGKIRLMKDPTNNKNIDIAYPGMATKCYITRFNDISTYDGTNQLPLCGEVIFVMDKPHAAQLLQYRMMVDDLERAINENRSDMRSYIKNENKLINDNDTDIMESMNKLDNYIETDYDESITFNSLDETTLNDKLFDDNDELNVIEDKINRVNELNKAIILRCDTVGSLNVLKQIIYESQIDNNNDYNVDKVKIVQYGLGNVTIKDLETQEQINSNQYDECRIYMFNVDLSIAATKFYQKLMKQEFPKENNISIKKTKYLFQTDETIKRFDVFTDLQNDVYHWLGYDNSSNSN